MQKLCQTEAQDKGQNQTPSGTSGSRKNELERTPLDRSESPAGKSILNVNLTHTGNKQKWVFTRSLYETFCHSDCILQKIKRKVSDNTMRH